MPVVHDHPLLSVATDPGSRILRVTRSAVPYESVADVEPLHREVGAVLDRLGRREHALLIDLRMARGTNAPGFEDAMTRSRKVLFRDFSKVAVVVKSATGSLQVQRHAREDGVDLRVFHDEEAALGFLRDETKSSRPPRSAR